MPHNFYGSTFGEVAGRNSLILQNPQDVAQRNSYKDNESSQKGTNHDKLDLDKINREAMILKEENLHHQAL